MQASVPLLEFSYRRDGRDTRTIISNPPRSKGIRTLEQVSREFNPRKKTASVRRRDCARTPAKL